MKSFIALTIEELQGRLAKLTLAIEALKELEPDGETAVPPPRQDGNGKPATSPRASRKPAIGRKPAKAGSRSAALEQARRMLSAAGSLAEPLTAEALAKAVALADKKPAEAIFYRWQAKGWVSRAGRGEYKRTKSFPRSEVATPSARLSIPGLDPESLPDRLKRAREELADAKSKGQATLANILQHKIKKLERDLEAEAA